MCNGMFDGMFHRYTCKDLAAELQVAPASITAADGKRVPPESVISAGQTVLVPPGPYEEDRWPVGSLAPLKAIAAEIRAATGVEVTARQLAAENGLTGVTEVATGHWLKLPTAAIDWTYSCCCGVRGRTWGLRYAAVCCGECGEWKHQTCEGVDDSVDLPGHNYIGHNYIGHN